MSHTHLFGVEKAPLPLIMGILNVTPDSFSDGGRFSSQSSAIEHALSMAEEGADLIDVGGESTRPGADPVPEAEEIERVIPVIESLSSLLSIPISVDTRRPRVAEAACQAGASIINDVEGFRNPEMAAVALKHNTWVVVMHMKGTPKEMQKNPHYRDVVRDVTSFLSSQRNMLVERGIPPHKIVVDPGIGFGKRFQDNIALIKNLYTIKRKVGQPLLLGHSRKSFLGEILEVPPKERDVGTTAVTIFAALQGVDIVRVHNVKMCRQALQVVEILTA